MIYSRDIPFWSGTLGTMCITSCSRFIQPLLGRTYFCHCFSGKDNVSATDNNNSTLLLDIIICQSACKQLLEYGVKVLYMYNAVRLKCPFTSLALREYQLPIAGIWSRSVLHVKLFPRCHTVGLALCFPSLLMLH